MGGIQRRRRRMRHHHPVVEVPEPAVEVPEPVSEPAVEEKPAEPVLAPTPKPMPPRHKPHPSPHDIAELSGAFAMTANVADPEPEAEPVFVPPTHHDHEDVVTERGLRGLVGGGASQVSVAAALRARDAARPSDADLTAAEEELVIVRRGWVPREELPRPGRR